MVNFLPGAPPFRMHYETNPNVSEVLQGDGNYPYLPCIYVYEWKTESVFRGTTTTTTKFIFSLDVFARDSIKKEGSRSGYGRSSPLSRIGVDDCGNVREPRPWKGQKRGDLRPRSRIDRQNVDRADHQRNAVSSPRSKAYRFLGLSILHHHFFPARISG